MAASRCRLHVQETSGDQPATAAKTPAPGPRPLLIYDGDCGFCGYWARYWQKLTGDRVEYRPYQEVAAQYPEISQAEFQRAVQYIAPDGHRASAAEASFLTLSHAPGKGVLARALQNVPGFAAVSELAYAFIAAHRPAFYRVSLLLWGRNHEPPRYDLVSFLFLRLLGLIYLSAFVSFAVQAQGLIGSHGILPLAEFVDSVAGRFGPSASSWCRWCSGWTTATSPFRPCAGRGPGCRCCWSSICCRASACFCSSRSTFRCFMRGKPS